VAVRVIAQSTGEPVIAAVELDATGQREIATSGRAEITGVAPGRHVVTVHAAGYLPERLDVQVEAGITASLDVALYDAAPRLEEITVTASRYDVVDAVRPSASAFTRDQIESLAELGDDALRVAHRLPGIASSEFSARSHVRGGAADEMRVLIDGVEIAEPYHLRDYEGLFSIIDERSVASLQIYSGGFPAEYGRALSGLMVVEPRVPTKVAHEVGVSLLHTSLLSSGTFEKGNGAWLASARRSNLGDVLNNDRGDPAYHDLFLRVGLDIAPRHRLTFGRLGFDDDVVLAPSATSAAQQTARSEVDGEQFWLMLDSDWTPRLSSRSWFYSTQLDSLRRESLVDPLVLVGSVLDRRELDSRGVKQHWRFEPSDSQIVRFGFEARRSEALYRYASAGERRGLLASVGPPVAAQREVALDPELNETSVFFSDRLRLAARLVAELGLRVDRQDYAAGERGTQTSPRASLLYRFSDATDLRVSYGEYYQSEGLLELQVEDGITAFAPAQDASHTIFGLEHRLDGNIALRVEAFRKATHVVRPRFENLFDPLVLLREMQPGRVLIVADRAEAHGLEVLVSGGRRVPWWLGYSVSRAEDVIAGRRVPRSWDQRYALDAGLSFDAGPWHISAAANLHSGWPATLVTTQVFAGQPAVVLGERNAERLDTLQRVDFRASRALDLRRGGLRLYSEVTNVTDRDNPCCLRYEPGVDATGAETLLGSERNGLPLTINFGLLWEF
jgi:outer membrane receptor protein involved in Fe transport